MWEVWWGLACRRRGVGSVVWMDMSVAKCGRCGEDGRVAGMGMSAARFGRCSGDGHVGGEVWEV